MRSLRITLGFSGSMLVQLVKSHNTLLSVSLFPSVCFVCGSSWKQSACWQRMKEVPGSSLMLPSHRSPADSLRRPLSPALLGGLRPAQGFPCDVGSLIKARASWIPRSSFPLSLYLLTSLAGPEGCQRLGFHLAPEDCVTLCFCFAMAKLGMQDLNGMIYSGTSESKFRITRLKCASIAQYI